jgi:hypothetical protein
VTSNTDDVKKRKQKIINFHLPWTLAWPPPSTQKTKVTDIKNIIRVACLAHQLVVEIATEWSFFPIREKEDSFKKRFSLRNSEIIIPAGLHLIPRR